MDGEDPPTPDSKTAKKAIAGVASDIEVLLKNRDDRIEAFVKLHLLEDKNAEDIVRELKRCVGRAPSLFGVLIRELANFPDDDGSKVAEELRSACAVAGNKARTRTGSEEGVQAITIGKDRTTASLLQQYEYKALSELKGRLAVMKDMGGTSDTVKSTIKAAIVKALKMANDPQTIKDELSRMKDLISPDIIQWALTETQRLYDEMVAPKDDDIHEHDDFVMPGIPAEVRNDDLYHAAVCCSAISHSNDRDKCKELFQSLSSMTVESFSMTQCEDQAAFPTCMVAIFSSSSNTKHKTCYVAFQDLRFRQLSTDANKSTFGKVLEHRIKKFPIQYLEDALREYDRLVLTGFSFGGVLAQMLAAQLWLLPHTHTDLLTSNVICITFGQPLIRSDLLTHVADPEFCKSVHAVDLEDDDISFVIEKLDTLISRKEATLSRVLNNLSCLQDYHMGRRRATPTFDEDIPMIPNSVFVGAQSKIEALLQLPDSLKSESAKHLPTNGYLIVRGENDVKLVKGNKQERANSVSYSLTPESFEEHTIDVYLRALKELTSAGCREQSARHVRTSSSDFVCPCIDRVRVNQYSDGTVVVVTGRQLWFVHSLRLSLAVFTEVLHVRETSVCFKTRIEDVRIPQLREETPVVAFSYFHKPVQKRLCIEFDLNKLSPRGRQVARLEPNHLLDLGLTISLLERCPQRTDTSGEAANFGQLPPFLIYFRQFLRDMAAVVPYESMLCAIAQCDDIKAISERHIRLLKQLSTDLPFSLSMYISLFITTFKIQHQTSIDPELLNEQSFEDCAYFMWLMANYSKETVKSFSDSLFTDPFVFGSLELLCEDAVYLRGVVQKSLKQVKKLSDVEAIAGTMSASDLYNWNNEKPGKEDTPESACVKVKSPISVLIDGRKVLQKAAGDTTIIPSDESSDTKGGSYNKTMEVLRSARGIHFDFCIRVLCDFIFQYVRVPFTEVNPLNRWKYLRYQIAPYSDIFKSDYEFWESMLKRCQRAIGKDSQVVEHDYREKLKFLITNIEPESSAHVAHASSKYSMYILEKKLKELCSLRFIDTGTSTDVLVRSWQSYYFKNCPLADVTSSHRNLIGRWIKWSLMLHELRTTLENHVTIAVAGLVNSGKTQLVKSLFGIQVKSGTIESRRTIVPFMYSLAPEVENVYVIDLPGADDSDEKVNQLIGDDSNTLHLIEIVKSIAHILVFVVSQDKAHTKDAKEWLSTFENRTEVSKESGSPTEFSHLRSGEASGPVLVCMTFADRVLAEVLENCSIGEAKTRVASHFEQLSTTCYGQYMWKPRGRKTLGCYSFDLSQSTLQESDMRAVNIGVPSDVGGWLCKQLREELQVCETADKLEKYFKKFCSGLDRKL